MRSYAIALKLFFHPINIHRYMYLKNSLRYETYLIADILKVPGKILHDWCHLEKNTNFVLTALVQYTMYGDSSEPCKQA